MKALALALAFVVAAAAADRPRITGIARVAYAVSDLGKAQAFYRDVLGLREEPGNVFRINERQSVKLIPEADPGIDRLRFIAFRTPDPDAMQAWLQERGLSQTDPDGHRIEFVKDEPTPFTPAPDRISDRMMHTGILVGGLGAALRYWQDSLGFVETWRGSRDGTVLNWVNLRVPDGDDYIEFMLYATKPKQTGGEHHLCLVVADINRAAAALAARPYTRELQPRVGVNRKRQLNLFDPDGTRTELMEPVTIDGTPTPPATAPPPIP